MQKKKRIKEDAFSWVEDTTSKTTKKPAGNKTSASRTPLQKSASMGDEPFFFIKYLKAGGVIVATQFRQSWMTSTMPSFSPWSAVPDDQDIVFFNWVDGMSLLSIHQDYHVHVNDDGTKELRGN